MKIAVSKIRANPFRRIASYPIDKAKVEALKTVKEVAREILDPIDGTYAVWD